METVGFDRLFNRKYPEASRAVDSIQADSAIV